MRNNPNTNLYLITIRKKLSKWGFTKKGLLTNAKGEWYLLSQLILIILHFLPYWPKTEYLIYQVNISIIVFGIVISIKGLIIVLKALLDLGENLSPLPYPMEESILIKKHSYKYSRHPLYKGILFISLGISIFSQSLIHFFLFILLTIVLKFKALKEEEKLKLKYKEYENYMLEVPAIIKNIKFLDWRF